MKKKIILYEHAGSSNHGCEAIIRSTAKLFDQEEVILASFAPEEDIKYGLDQICKVEACAGQVKRNLKYFISRLYSKYFHNNEKYWELSFDSFFNSVVPGSIYLSTGGDNYCYDTKIKGCMFINKGIKQKGGKTVLWGASIEPEIIEDKVVQEDLRLYDLIVARESITYKALLSNGINNVCLCPDPAFMLETQNVVLEDANTKKEFIGINISPMILDNSIDSNLVYENYKILMRYILDNTRFSILMIPHVVWNGGDDRLVIEKLCKDMGNRDRVIVVEDNTCCVLKGYISKCRFFVGARTHTTIASYSCNIPTLVVGYSVKARGIALDLLGKTDDYVIPVQSINKPDLLLNAFCNLVSQEDEVRNKLSNAQLDYFKQYKKVKEKILSL